MTDISDQMLDEMFSNPDPDNPYKFNGVNYAPSVVSRVVNTADDVVKVMREGKAMREIDDEELSERAHIPLENVRRLGTDGVGALEEFMAVADALGVRPVTVPYEMVMG